MIEIQKRTVAKLNHFYGNRMCRSIPMTGGLTTPAPSPAPKPKPIK